MSTNGDELGRPNYSASAAQYHRASPAPVMGRGPRIEPRAIQALLAAVLSWFVLPALAALVALQRARVARARIDASQGARTGIGVIQLARALAWANLLTAAVLAFYWWRSGHLFAFGYNLLFT